MIDINGQEYEIVASALLKSKRYVDDSNINPQQKQEWQERFDLAMGALDAVNKRLKASPEGGSAISPTDKLRNLMSMFGLRA